MLDSNKVKVVKSPLQLRLQEFHKSINRFKSNPSVSLLQEVEDIWICIYDILEEEVIKCVELEREEQTTWQELLHFRMTGGFQGGD